MARGEALSLASPEGLEELIEEHLPPRHEELDIPVTLLASDLLSCDKVLMKRGDLRQHTLISASLPGILPPVEVEGRVLVDGSIVANAPVLPAYHEGAASMVVCDPNMPCRLSAPPSSALGYLLHLLEVTIRHQSFGVLHLIEHELITAYIPCSARSEVALHDFSHTAELIDQGARSAREFLDGFDPEGPGIYGHPNFGSEEVDSEEYVTL